MQDEERACPEGKATEGTQERKLSPATNGPYIALLGGDMPGVYWKWESAKAVMREREYHHGRTFGRYIQALTYFCEKSGVPVPEMVDTHYMIYYDETRVVTQSLDEVRAAEDHGVIIRVFPSRKDVEKEARRVAAWIRSERGRLAASETGGPEREATSKPGVALTRGTKRKASVPRGTAPSKEKKASKGELEHALERYHIHGTRQAKRIEQGDAAEAESEAGPTQRATQPGTKPKKTSKFSA